MNYGEERALIKGDGLWLKDGAVRVPVCIAACVASCIAVLRPESHFFLLLDSGVKTWRMNLVCRIGRRISPEDFGSGLTADQTRRVCVFSRDQFSRGRKNRNSISFCGSCSPTLSLGGGGPENVMIIGPISDRRYLQENKPVEWPYASLRA